MAVRATAVVKDDFGDTVAACVGHPNDVAADIGHELVALIADVDRGAEASFTITVRVT